jgi:hypothetical protein
MRQFPVSNTRFIHKAVSKWFMLDWQFILATGRMPVFKPAAAVITALPFVTDFARLVPISTVGFWLLWAASVLSLVTFALTYFCPKFIRDYEDFNKYSEMGHTHRWIVWLFYGNLGSYNDKEYVIRETVDKLLTHQTDDRLTEAEYAVCPIDFGPQPAVGQVFAGKPVNIHRDIYVTLWIEGRRHVLALQESDPRLEIKIKELFWIIFTDLTKKAPQVRRLIWFLYAIIALLTICALALNIAKPLLKASPEVVSPLAQIGRVICGLLQ